jgi:sec-independent protein translocase protein TatB
VFGIGATELIVIMVVALLIFGPKRLPELARSLGRGMAEFRRASSDLRQTLQEAEPPAHPLKPPEPPEPPEPDQTIAPSAAAEEIAKTAAPSDSVPSPKESDSSPSDDDPGSRSG